MSKKSFRKTAIALALSGIAGVSHGALTAVDPGPYTAATGFFPLWYRDSTATTLDLCLSKAQSTRVPGVPGAPSYMCTLLPNPGIFDDAQPIVFPFNFPDEGFYYTGDATLSDPAQGIDRLVYVSAIEAAFAGGVPLAGDQITFARIRVVADVAVAGQYTITHPYGVEIVDVATPGPRAIALTRDIGVANGVFTGALAGDVGPFLRGAGGPYNETNPETGALETFIGDPNLVEPVTGSPFGTNFVRITGPGGISITTTDFAVSGRIWNGLTPTQVTVDRSSYTRTATSTKVDVFATAPTGSTVTFRETLPLGIEIPMTEATGQFYGTDPAAVILPPYVIVTADTATTTPTPIASALVDVVKVSKVTFAKDTKELTIEARSSDEVVVPTLTVVGLNATLTPVAGTLQRAVITLPAEPPAFVTIQSSAGGKDLEPVVVVATAAANQQPVAVADTATTNEDTPVTIAVLANDSDPDLDPLTVSAVTNGANGTATTNGTTVTYTPNANFNGTDTFTYSITDGRGGLATANVTVTVNPVNDPPVAVADNITTAEDTPITVTTASLLANDTDVDGPAPLSITAVGGAVNGTVSLVAGNVTFTPNLNFNGPARFNYTVTDGIATATGTVNVTVTPVNDPPVANPDTASVQAPNPVTINVLANDTDVDGNPLTVAAVTPPANGSVTTNGVSVTYTPNAGFSGVDTFTYTASDGNGGSAVGTVTVNVAAAANGVDLDIGGFVVTARQRVNRNVTIRLVIRNNSAINQTGTARLIGIQNGATVYDRSITVSDPPGGGQTQFAFPNFVPTQVGVVNWTVTVTDGNPDNDVATAVTNVIP